MSRVSEVDAFSMVFDVGDVVAGWGRIGSDDEGVWLDLARVNGLTGATRRNRPNRRSVALVGGDFSAVPTEFAPDNAVPGIVTVTGRWLGDAIEVYRVAATGPVRTPVPEWIVPPCPAPPGGWPADAGPDGDTLRFEAGDLQATGAAESLVLFRPGSGQVVLVVTATDVDAVEAVLRPQLGHRLCVVPSRWTSRRLKDVWEEASDHFRDWTIDHMVIQTNGDAQNVIDIHLFRVTDEIAAWANEQPDELITLHPSLAQA